VLTPRGTRRAISGANRWAEETIVTEPRVRIRGKMNYALPYESLPNTVGPLVFAAATVPHERGTHKSGQLLFDGWCVTRTALCHGVPTSHTKIS
jgi:hypothetical protein